MAAGVGWGACACAGALPPHTRSSNGVRMPLLTHSTRSKGCELPPCRDTGSTLTWRCVLAASKALLRSASTMRLTSEPPWGTIWPVASLPPCIQAQHESVGWGQRWALPHRHTEVLWPSEICSTDLEGLPRDAVLTRKTCLEMQTRKACRNMQYRPGKSAEICSADLESLPRHAVQTWKACQDTQCRPGRPA